MLVVAPLLALLISNGDVLLLVTSKADERAKLLITFIFAVPSSALAGGITVWFMLRLRREIDHRARTERDLRRALTELEAALRDVTRGLERERLLRRELDHRVRNNLAALLGLVGLYQQSNAPPSEIVRSLRSKIVTLREVYGLMTASHEEGIDLKELLRTVAVATMGGVDTHRVRIDGPSVRMSTREGNAAAMIVQELITNSFKHGALREPAGTIDISWACERDAVATRLRLLWHESPVPQRQDVSSESGIGLSLIQGFAKSDLRGNVSFARTPEAWNVEVNATLAPSSNV